MKLSILIPCFNEERTLAEILRRVLRIRLNDIDKEIVIVDDGSTDNSLTIARQFETDHPDIISVHAMPANRGKGAAVLFGLARSNGELVLVQDADLEYDPADYPALLAPFADPAINVVYGSRILGSHNRSYHRYYWGGRLVTLMTNLLYQSRLTDEPTGYKVVRRATLEGLNLSAEGFEFCAELTARLLRAGQRVVEVPIGYQPRSFAEGKKIRWQDGVHAIWTLVRHRFR